MDHEYQATKSVKIIKWINLVTSYTPSYLRVAIVAFGVAGTIFLAVNNILAGRFFMVFSPIFMMYLFG